VKWEAPSGDQFLEPPAVRSSLIGYWKTDVEHVFSSESVMADVEGGKTDQLSLSRWNGLLVDEGRDTLKSYLNGDLEKLVHFDACIANVSTNVDEHKFQVSVSFQRKLDGEPTGSKCNMEGTFCFKHIEQDQNHDAKASSGSTDQPTVDTGSLSQVETTGVKPCSLGPSRTFVNSDGIAITDFGGTWTGELPPLRDPSVER
jgi:hypothetical protein